MAIVESNGRLEISRTLHLSTAHVTEGTKNYLDSNLPKLLVVYDKPDYGWFIYLVEEDFEQVLKEVPSDLSRVLRFTKEQGCDMLCFDRDVEIFEGLPSYEW